MGGAASIVVLVITDVEIVVVVVIVEVVVVVVSCWPMMLTWRCATDTKSLRAAADCILLLCLKTHTLGANDPNLLD